MKPVSGVVDVEKALQSCPNAGHGVVDGDSDRHRWPIETSNAGIASRPYSHDNPDDRGIRSIRIDRRDDWRCGDHNGEREHLLRDED